MRILVAHNVSKAPTGGMSRIMTFIHERLGADHEVDYLCAEDLPARLGGHLARFSFTALVLLKARDAARQGKPYDIVNVHEPSSALIAACKKLAGSPAVVVTSHGLESRAWRLALEEKKLGRQGPSLKSRLAYPLTSLWQSALGLRLADQVFCLNEEDKQDLLKRGVCASENVTRIFPGADPVYARAAQGREYRPVRRILFAATWRKNKGLEDLIPAFVSLLREDPVLQLTVLGGGFPEQTIRASFPEQIQAQLHCRHCSSDEEAARVFAEHDLFVLPSLFEGTPLTLMEAMTSGLPIVTTNVCGMKDVIEHGRNGLLVPIRSPDLIAVAVRSLKADPALAARLGQAARADALQRYTWERAAQPVLERYLALRAA
ncbi:MAG: glycosyltransferase family 4 protein [Myxococcaceae bacterium]